MCCEQALRKCVIDCKSYMLPRMQKADDNLVGSIHGHKEALLITIEDMFHDCLEGTVKG